MSWGWAALILLSAMLAAPASAQDAPEPETSPPEGIVVVVVESARRSIRPEAIRSALSERLGNAAVAGLRVDGDTPRARVVVAVHRDGSADLHVLSRNGNEDMAHVPAAAEGTAPAITIAERIRELLGEAEEDPPIGTVARHGLIPWDQEGLRPYPNPGIRRVDSDPLLPWPNGVETRDSATRTEMNTEPADGLTTPTPRTPNAYGAQKR